MRRRTGGSLLPTATSELTSLTATRLSALQQPRLPDVDEDRPGAWANQVVASEVTFTLYSCSTSLRCANCVREYEHGAKCRRRARGGPGHAACFRWRPRPFRAFDGGRVPFARVSCPPPSSWSSSCTGARCCGGCVRLASLLPRELLNGRHGGVHSRGVHTFTS